MWHMHLSIHNTHTERKFTIPPDSACPFPGMGGHIREGEGFSWLGPHLVWMSQRLLGVQAGDWASLIYGTTYLKPRKRTCSHIQANSSKMIMVGKAKPNQDAKFTTLPFWGKSLTKRTWAVV